MTEQEKVTLKKKITTELEQLAHHIGQLKEIIQPMNSDDMDEISRMDALMSKSVNATALAASQARLAGLKYALKRIGTAEYGFCHDCGTTIPFARLLLMPETSYCVDCAKE